MVQLEDESIKLKVGEQATIALPSLGTAGYVWQESISDNTQVISVNWRRGGGSAPQHHARAGVSSPEVLTINGEEAGVVTVRLRQVRPWQPDSSVIATRSITVTVVPASESTDT